MRTSISLHLFESAKSITLKLFCSRITKFLISPDLSDTFLYPPRLKELKKTTLTLGLWRSGEFKIKEKGCKRLISLLVAEFLSFKLDYSPFYFSGDRIGRGTSQTFFLRWNTGGRTSSTRGLSGSTRIYRSSGLLCWSLRNKADRGSALHSPVTGRAAL